MDTDESKVVVALVAVGDKYVQEIIPYYRQLKQWGYRVAILTDQPLHFNIEDVTLYTKSIFNYFDKIYFALNNVKQYQQTIVYVDGSTPISREQINQYVDILSSDFLYIEDWPLGGFDQYKDKANFKYLVDYLNVFELPIKNYPTIREQVMVFNSTIDYKTVVNELEMIQPVFDYMGLLNYKMYDKQRVIGEAEGLALSIVLDQSNIRLQKVTVKKVAT